MHDMLLRKLAPPFRMESVTVGDDFRGAWAEAVAMYRKQKAENDRLREKLEAEISKLIDENRKLRAEVSRSSYHCD